MTDCEGDAMRTPSLEEPNQIADTGQEQTDTEASNPLVQKYDEYRNVLKTRPEDFQTWTYLLSTAERIDAMDKIVVVFDEFLTQYPLCYGYWKKYADMSMKHLGLDASTQIYERGVAAVPYSVDLWSHYVTFRITKSADAPETIRTLFERGLAFVGADYLCHPFWEKYIQFELDQSAFGNTTRLYTRLLSVPFKDLETYHGKFQIFASEHSLTEMLTPEEIESLRKQIQAKQDNRDADVHMTENSNLQKTADDLMDTDSDDLKQYWLQSVADIYAAARQELTVRKEYEDCIKRPYFHVKPLDNIQLQAWWKYLDCIRSKDNHGETVILFERCLVACASYPEFWMRYALYMEARSTTDAGNIVRRAVEVFCSRKSEMHLFAARFYERLGDIERSRRFLEHVTALTPTLLAGVIQHAAFEYRQNATEAGNAIYEAKIRDELENKESAIVGHLAIQYAHVQIRRFAAADKARGIMREVLNQRPDLLCAWEGAIQIEELIQDDSSIQRSLNLYRECVMENTEVLDVESQCMMSMRLLQFVDMHGSAEEHAQAHEYHLAHFGLRTIAPSLHKKRTDSGQKDNATATQSAQGNSAPTGNEDGNKAAQVITTAAMTEFFAQNPAAQQYAQYYQYAAAAAAAAGYSGYAAFSAPFSG